MIPIILAPLLLMELYKIFPFITALLSKYKTSFTVKLPSKVPAIIALLTLILPTKNAFDLIPSSKNKEVLELINTQIQPALDQKK